MAAELNNLREKADNTEIRRSDKYKELRRREELNNLREKADNIEIRRSDKYKELRRLEVHLNKLTQHLSIYQL